MLGLKYNSSELAVLMVKRGELVGHKEGRSWRIDGDSLEAAVRDRMGLREMATALHAIEDLEAEVGQLRTVIGGPHTPEARVQRRTIRAEWELSHGRRKRTSISKRVRWLILERDGHRCVYCGATPDDGIRLVVDHRIPVVDGGTSEPDNLAAACEDCNDGKRDAPLVDA